MELIKGWNNFHIIITIFLALVSMLAAGNLTGIRREDLFSTEKHMIVLRYGVALAIAINLFSIALLLYRVVPFFYNKGYTHEKWVVSAVYLLLVIILIRHSFSLFPKKTGFIILSDRSQKAKISVCLSYLFFAFLFLGAWNWFLVFSVASYSWKDQVIHVTFSFILLVGFLVMEKLLINMVYEQLERNADIQYQTELLNFMQVIRSQRHDFNFHMQAVAGMIESRKYEECDQYVRSMVKNVERLNDVLPLKNPAIAALVHTFLEISSTKGIHMEVQILDQLEKLPCTIYEMNSVIGNLLQNAIDETEGKEQANRWIHLLIMKRSRRYIIKVSNPCDKKPEDYTKIFEMGYSTKLYHDGVGLVSVKKTVARYGGTVYLEHEPSIVHFIAKFPVKEEN